MVDVAASWFAQCFEAGNGLETVLAELTDLTPSWQEIEWEKNAVHVKINRDNYALEHAANDFLKKAGFNLSGHDLLDDPDDEGETTH